MVWNGLDYSALVFPVTKADPSIDVKQPRDKFFSEADKYFYELCKFQYQLCELILSNICLDEPETFKNGPASLQLVGHTLEEEAVIGMTEIVDAAVKEYKAKH